MERVRAALAYAEAFPEEIAADTVQADANRKWIGQHDAAWRKEGKGANRAGGGAGHFEPGAELLWGEDASRGFVQARQFHGSGQRPTTLAEWIPNARTSAVRSET